MLKVREQFGIVFTMYMYIVSHLSISYVSSNFSLIMFIFSEKYPTEIIRFGTVVMRLPELLKSNHEHSKIMHQIVKNYNIKIPQLFFEVFLNHERVR